MSHGTPRMGNRPDDPAFHMLKDHLVSKPKVHRAGCYICTDMEFARMGLPLCNLCCNCKSLGRQGHIAADDDMCDDCEHQLCEACFALPAEDQICTCNTPCCELTGADIGIPEFAGVAYDCGSQHCPTHGFNSEVDG